MAVGGAAVVEESLVAANVYLGALCGVILAASLPAGGLAAAVERGLRRSVLAPLSRLAELAVAAEAAAVGGLLVGPAALALSGEEGGHPLSVPAAALAGALLGLLVATRADTPRPPADEPEAVVTVQRAAPASLPDRPRDPRWLLTGGVVGAGVQLLNAALGVLRPVLEDGIWLGGRLVYGGCALSAGLVGAGWLVGLRFALLLGMGSALGWWVVGPGLAGSGEAGSEPVAAAWELWREDVVYVAVGALAVAGAARLLTPRCGLAAVGAALRRLPADLAALPRSLPRRGRLAVGLGVATPVLLILASAPVHGVLVATGMAVPVLVAAASGAALATRLTSAAGDEAREALGLVSAVTVVALPLLLGAEVLGVGTEAFAGLTASLGLAAWVAGRMGSAGTGRGPRDAPDPRRLLRTRAVGLALGIALAASLALPSTTAALRDNGIAVPHALLLAGGALAVTASAWVEWSDIAVGVGLAGAVLVLDALLAQAKARVRVPLLPVALGLAVPLPVAVPVLLGALAERAARRAGPSVRRRGLLVAAGLAGGEAVVVLVVLLATLS